MALAPKESILFMQRLASLDRSGLTDGPIKAVWESTFLDMVYSLSTTVCPEAPEVRPGTTRGARSHPPEPTAGGDAA